MCVVFVPLALTFRKTYILQNNAVLRALSPPPTPQIHVLYFATKLSLGGEYVCAVFLRSVHSYRIYYLYKLLSLRLHERKNKPENKMKF